MFVVSKFYVLLGKMGDSHRFDELLSTIKRMSDLQRSGGLPPGKKVHTLVLFIRN